MKTQLGTVITKDEVYNAINSVGSLPTEQGEIIRVCAQEDGTVRAYKTQRNTRNQDDGETIITFASEEVKHDSEEEDGGFSEFMTWFHDQVEIHAGETYVVD